MKLMKRLMLLFLMVAISSALAYAHPGRTDSKGGHTNHSTGEYHYHHGYPEHQHTGGVCPYDFDDQTGKNSGTSSGSENKAVNQKPAISNQTAEVKEVPSWIYWVIGILSVISFGMFFELRSTKRENKQMRIDLRDKKEIQKENANMKKELNKKAFDIQTLQAKSEYQAKTIQGLMTKTSELMSIIEQVSREASVEDFVRRFNENGASEIEIPSDIYFINGLIPVTGKITEDHPYGDLTVYITDSGQRYHSYRGCGSGYLRAAHAYDVLGTKTPCKVCARPFPTRPPEWYAKIKAITDRSQI